MNRLGSYEVCPFVRSSISNPYMMYNSLFVLSCLVPSYELASTHMNFTFCTFQHQSYLIC
ncbi:hypothetical protein HanRHA438_Chr02g0058021 [Helianthus annuus]|nr:hypothetical protein HanRHA438_Chr02g0058021 [Helianthus annuus]